MERMNINLLLQVVGNGALQRGNVPDEVGRDNSQELVMGFCMRHHFRHDQLLGGCNE